MKQIVNEVDRAKVPVDTKEDSMLERFLQCTITFCLGATCASVIAAHNHREVVQVCASESFTETVFKLNREYICKNRKIGGYGK